MEKLKSQFKYIKSENKPAMQNKVWGPSKVFFLSPVSWTQPITWRSHLDDSVLDLCSPVWDNGISKDCVGIVSIENIHVLVHLDTGLVINKYEKELHEVKQIAEKWSNVFDQLRSKEGKNISLQDVQKTASLILDIEEKKADIN